MHRAGFALLALLALLALACLDVATARGQSPAAEAAAHATSAAEAKDWPAAERSWLQAAEFAAERARTNPDDLDAAIARDTFQYNAACAAALQGRSDVALGLLSGLLDRGWLDDRDLLASDSDLDALRADAARFMPVLARARSLVAEATRGHAEGLILAPRRMGKRRVPCVVALHGGGGNIESWSDAWQPVADLTGAVVILVRGSRVQGRGAFSWDQRQPARDASRIEEWIGRAKERFPAIDERDAYLTGFSQGGGMAWLLATEGERAWAGVIPIGGYVQVAARSRAMAQPAHPLAVHAFVGAEDEPAIRDVNAALVAREGLRDVRARLESLPGGHGLPANMPEAFGRAMRWCRKARAAMRA